MPSGGQGWKSTRHDKYYQLAKEQGYRSRAAFKLIQLNKKYQFLEKSRSILDLCCAPGGWLQVCSKYANSNSIILGIDLLPCKPVRGCTILQYDITTQQCEIAIKKQLKQYKLDLCVHDGAPNISGGFNFSRDVYIQNELVLKSLQLACKYLDKNATFVTKVFRSNEYNNLIYIFNQLFASVEINKPLASRSTSAEIFVVCRGYLAPKTIDEKLFQSKYVFQHFDSAQVKNNNPFNQKLNMKQRNRSGYADNQSQIIETKMNILQYIDSKSVESAIELLGTATQLTFKSEVPDEQQLIDLYKSHTGTTDEIQSLLSDLRVIGKGDFKQLLKWRKLMIHYKKTLHEQARQQQAGQSDNDNAVIESSPSDQLSSTPTLDLQDDSKLDSDVNELHVLLSKQQKKALKKKKLLKQKQHKKMLINLHNANLEGDTNDITYFSVNSITGKHSLDHVIDNDQLIDDMSDNDHSDEPNNGSDVDVDSDDSSNEYYTQLEHQLDDYYNTYRNTQMKTQINNQKQSELADTIDNQQFDTQHMNNSSDDEIDENVHSDNDNEFQPLNVEFNDNISTSEQTRRWFDRDIFSTVQQQNYYKTQSSIKRKANELIQSNNSDDSDDESDDDNISVDNRYNDGDSDDDDDMTDINNQQPTPNQLSQSRGHLLGLNSMTTSITRPHTIDDDEFTTVPLDGAYSSDDDAVAERLALGTQMLQKRSREHIIDSGYNRYIFNDDTDTLPDWFIDNESIHNKPQLPVTAQQVSQQKAKLIAINARPIKKIAEAKARKKIRAVRRWEKVKSQSDNIMNSTELNSTQKIKQIEQMMIKQHSKKKKSKHAEKQYVVAKKGGGTASSGVRAKKGARIVKVDRKMKKDRRGLKNAEKRRTAKSKGKGSKRQKT